MARHCVISVDTAGLEPATSHCTDIVVDAAGALPFRAICPLILFRITGRRIKPRADRRPLLTRSQRFRGRTSPDCQRKRLPVELPGTVALTGGCVFRGLLVQNRRVQTVQSRLFGAVSDSGLVVLLRAAACVSLVSSQGFSPPLRRELRQ